MEASMSTDTKTRPHVAVWFEIPASDFERAVNFYETVFAIGLTREAIGQTKLAVFPYEKPGVSGCVIAGDGYNPGRDGAVVYINCDGKLDEVLARVWSAGGKVARPKTDLPPGMGSFAHIVDVEGNRVGLHAVS
jgi:hypothetical protein